MQVAKLARALEVRPSDLIEDPLDEYELFARHANLIHAALPSVEYDDPEAWRYASHEGSGGYWLETAREGEMAALMYPPNSEMFVEAKLLSVQMRQQASLVEEALTTLNELRGSYVRGEHERDRWADGSIAVVGTWLDVNQLWDVEAAAVNLPIALEGLRETGDQERVREVHFFLARLALETALAAQGAWITASPGRRRLTAAERGKLSQAALVHLAACDAFERDNPYTVTLRHRIGVVVGETNPSRWTLERNRGLFIERDRQHLYAEEQARTALQAGDAVGALQHLEEMEAGYKAVRFPIGLATAAALKARALRELKDLNAERDNWVLALLMHPFRRHPLWRESMAGLAQWAGREDALESLIEWVQEELPHAVRSRSGSFEILQHVDRQPSVRDLDDIRDGLLLRFLNRSGATRNRSG